MFCQKRVNNYQEIATLSTFLLTCESQIYAIPDMDCKPVMMDEYLHNMTGKIPPQGVTFSSAL